MSAQQSSAPLELENAQLRERLAEAESVIRAIRQGDIDAVVVSGDEGDRVFTLEGADHPYRILVESMNEGAATLDQDGTVLYSNPRLASLLGTTTAHLAGARFADWLAPQQAAHFEQLVSASIGGNISGELVLRTSAGEPLPVHASLSSLLFKGVQCCCAVITDLSLAKHHAALAAAAEYVRQVNDRLREADRRKDEFLATLAHELRNPLAPIRASAYVLKKLRAEDDRMVQARDMIERQTAHMTRLIDDLLEMSRITQGKIQLQRHTENLCEVITSVAESARAAMEARGHQFAIELPDEALLIDADAIRIAQAIFNVLENAAKYTPSGGQVVLQASRQAEQAVVTVQDNGIGIAADMTTRIFEMFVQADSAGRRVQGGLGIGLALSRRLIELHGGTIDVTSAGLGQGSLFTMRLPLTGTAQPQRKMAGLQTAPLCRVLVVDDNIDAADSLCALLQLSGHSAKAVYRGTDALEILPQYQPELVLLDIGLPDIDGYEVARRIRARYGAQRPTLVALTGWGQDDDKEHALEAGMDAHLTKPVDAIALEQVLVQAARAAAAGS